MTILTTSYVDYQYLEKKILESDLILVDIDGVIITPPQYLCSSHWYVDYLKNTNATNQSLEFKMKVVDDLYYCMSKTQFILVDQGLVALLNKYSDTHAIVGLTGRTISFHSETQNWIDRVGMEFSNHNFDVFYKDNVSILRSGIIYVGHDPYTSLPWDKGEALGKFIKQYNKKVQNILFIDDMMGNHMHMSKFCNNSDLEFFGLHFTKVATHYDNQFQHETLRLIGEKQFDYLFHNDLAHILSDEEAQKVLHYEACVAREEFL